MPRNERVVHNISHVNFLEFADNLLVLLHENPAYMGEEQSSFTVVRIILGVTVPVVDSVIAYPSVQGILKRENRVLHERT